MMYNSESLSSTQKVDVADFVENAVYLTDGELKQAIKPNNGPKCSSDSSAVVNPNAQTTAPRTNTRPTGGGVATSARPAGGGATSAPPRVPPTTTRATSAPTPPPGGLK